MTELKNLETLIDALESEDAFERLEAIEALDLLTRQRLDFPWQGSPAERRRAVRRWRRWLSREKERRQQVKIQDTLQVLSQGSPAQIDPKTLQKMLKALPSDQAKQLMQQILKKVSSSAGVASSHPVCERCERRPATVRVTLLDEHGDVEGRRLCEVCAVSETP